MKNVYIVFSIVLSVHIRTKPLLYYVCIVEVVVRNIKMWEKERKINLKQLGKYNFSNKNMKFKKLNSSLK